jgi:outer membrane protein assembly factor BamA
VRGFRDASLSGGEGARAIFATALEWRVPLLPRSDSDARVHGALFVDTGTWIDADGSSNDWATSVGWGLRVRLPWIQRLSIDMGVPLTPTVTGDPFWVHFGLGFGF